MHLHQPQRATSMWSGPTVRLGLTCMVPDFVIRDRGESLAEHPHFDHLRKVGGPPNGLGILVVRPPADKSGI